MFLLRHPFLILFTVVLLESMLLAKVGSTIGWGLTILLILLSTFVGSYMVRQQGFQTFQRLQRAMARGENPGPEILEGFFIMAGGMLLVTPGFISDTLGFLLLIPFTRKALVLWVSRQLANLPMSAGVVQDQWTYGFRPGQGQVYEGERADPPVTRPVSEQERLEIIITTEPAARAGEPAPDTSAQVPADVIEGEFSRKDD